MTTRLKQQTALTRTIKRLETRIGARAKRGYWLSMLRLGVAVVGLVATLAVRSELSNGAGLAVFLVFAAVFAFLVRAHRQVQRSLNEHILWKEIKETHLARSRLDWAGIPAAKVVSAENRHPIEVDLNLIGEHSLNQLLNTAASQAGRDRLRDWLRTETADLPTIKRRQNLVKELAVRPLFRDKLILNARLALKGNNAWSDTALISWLQSTSVQFIQGWMVAALTLLALLNWGLFAAFYFTGFSPVWTLSFGLYFLISGLILTRGGNLFKEALQLQDGLLQLQGVFTHLENFSYQNTPFLKELCAPFQSRKMRPSQFLRSVVGIVSAMSLRGNPIAWFIINVLLPWDVYFAYRLQKQKAALAEQLPHWLDVWYELEALSSLANFAHLNPNYVWPEVDAGLAEMLVSAEISHPLLPHDEKVRNNFSAEKIGDLNLITGSNMSGKSTFLRTLGINLQLANAGSVVDAQRFQLQPVRLFTCIQVSDSVTDGFSYFYAEVRRLKALLDTLETGDSLPLIYLIDEIFRGTNNRERLVGSRSLIRAMAGGNGVGFVSTHDLELVGLSAENSAIHNYHFRETVEDGLMVFDYTVRDGPSPTTNALKIMRLAGLPVDTDDAV